MPRPSHKQPTNAELEILQVLWQRGQATVREVLTELSQAREIGYTTVLKLMQIMADKGLVLRDASVRPQVYKSTRTEKQTKKQLTGEFLERLFDGSPGKLVMQALSSRRTSPKDLAQIRELLDRL
ncbi:MAG: BlaI/MecI/CopY family transcriptional regulator, partial [Planctomycetota bacterium]|nr:BlaI/MecI/CopY family transcriptional regulator [Planctomycetota bacterium]